MSERDSEESNTLSLLAILLVGGVIFISCLQPVFWYLKTEIEHQRRLDIVEQVGESARRAIHDGPQEEHR